MEVTNEMEQPISSVEVIDDAQPASTDVPSTETATPGQAAQAAEVAPAYQPSYKYSVRGQEKEISEKYRALIKDAESEKELKELFEKADGIDFVKGDRDQLKTEYKEFKSQVVPYLQEYHKFTSMRDKGNLGAALQVAGISNEQIFKFAHDLLLAEQNPQLAQTYQQTQTQSLRELELEQELNNYKQQNQLNDNTRFQQELDQSLAAHKSVSAFVDDKMGKPGAFMEEVQAYGMANYAKGIQVSPAEATEAVANRYKPFMTQAAPIAAAPAYQRPAVIPNTGSSNVSAVDKRPKTLDDLKKLRNEAS